jgi:HEAT repeat protein
MKSCWLEELIAQLGAEDGRTRLRARETLVAIGEPALVPLVELLGSPEARLRWEAAKALAEAPEPAAIPGLISLLADRQSEIGWLAAVGLINMGNRSVPYVLQALTERAESKRFRAAAHHVLHDLSERNPVVRDILGPVLDVLGDLDPTAGVISSRAEAALHELRALSGG